MSSHSTHTEPNTLPYSEASDAEAVARSTSRLPNPVFSQSPLQFSSRHIPESATSTARFENPEQQAYSSMGDITCRGDCCYGREFFPSARGCDAPALKYPLDLPSTLSQSSVTSPKTTIDPLSHGTPAHPVFFTDDANMKLDHRIRRQCFNCKTTETKAWRRSVLSPGKMVCNKCGLFERTHAVSRPNTFPRRHWHHSQPTPVYTNMDHPFGHAENRDHDDRLSVQPFTTDSHFPNAFGPTGGETSSQGTIWVNHGALPSTSHLSPSHTVSPQPSSTPHHAGSHLSSTVPAEPAYLPSHLGVSRHPPSVVENRYFNAFSRAS